MAMAILAFGFINCNHLNAAQLENRMWEVVSTEVILNNKSMTITYPSVESVSVDDDKEKETRTTSKYWYYNSNAHIAYEFTKEVVADTEVSVLSTKATYKSWAYTLSENKLTMDNNDYNVEVLLTNAKVSRLIRILNLPDITNLKAVASPSFYELLEQATAPN